MRYLFLFLLPVCVSADVASWYEHGHMTANGERFTPYGLTAAHRTLAYGTRVRVTNKQNLKSVVVTINDNGPFVKGRTIDLSRSAFKQIADLDEGLIDVRIEVLKSGGPDRKRTGTHLDR